MTTSEQINEIAAALSKAQGAMAPAIKDSTNPAFRSKYADLAANVEAARGPLASNGLSVVQEATLRSTEDGSQRAVSVATRILHSSGQWIQFDPLSVPCAKADAHGVGSATTYARRYALGAVLGLVAEDDDGNGAVQGAQPKQEAVEPKGYANWWGDMVAVADNGTKALQEAWKASKPEHRSFTTANRAKAWDALKAKAEAVKEHEPVGA